MASRGLCRPCYRRWYRAQRPTYSRDWKRAASGERLDRIREGKRLWWEANREKKRAYRQKRKALERGGSGFRGLSHREVAERDGWRCHICGRRVTEKTWTLDHLIPLSAGGENVLVNVALAHRSCNSARGAGRIPAQLRLLG